MRYLTNDGHTIEGDSPEAVVSELHRRSRSPTKDDVMFMVEMAKRVYDQTGQTISTASPTELVADLISIGLLKPILERKVNDGEQRDS